MSPAPRASRPPLFDARRYEVSDSLGHNLVQLLAQMRREMELRMAQHGLTDAQWKPLWLLAQGRAGTAIELARESCIDAGAMTRMVDRLVAKGLVERLRSETDRRVVNLRLTAAGEAAASHVPAVLASIHNDVLEGFSAEEWAQLKGFLARARANAEALQAQHGREAA